MAREQQQQATVGGEGEPMRKRKSVRFGECPDPGSSGGVGGVVPNLVPHLPGLDPDALYVISGPFPQYDEGSGISNMVRLTSLYHKITNVLENIMQGDHGNAGADWGDRSSSSLRAASNSGLSLSPCHRWMPAPN